ncbi:MAG: permease [Nitrospinota bacterium]
MGAAAEGALLWRRALWASVAALLLAALATRLFQYPPSALAAEVWRIGGFVLGVSWRILPYFLLSVTLAAAAAAGGWAERRRGALRARERVAVAGAAAFGALSPLCSCGVIPVVGGMLAAGVPLAPIMAFWVSSPLMSPSTFILTWGVLGTPMALARLAVALLLGAGAGYLAYALGRRGRLQGQLRGGFGCAASGGGGGGGGGGEAPSFGIRFLREAGSLSLFLGKWLLIAFALEALIVFYLPDGWVRGLLGGESAWAIPLATAVGVPLYVTAAGAIPIAEGLLEAGMGPGAALAFLTAGPVTTIPAMVAVAALVRRETFLLYLGVSFAGSLLAGYGYQFLAG